ncbi:hypothetical protein [Kitasatospora sp. KL5]|uniref:hypothetical protein n=1 Tax=Kitasatospora sp. KL5 TaxID=3425125 RepID=UPI003D6F85EA
MAGMMLAGPRITAPRMLLLNRVDFEPGCYVFTLDQPLFLMPGDQVCAEARSVAVLRASGAVERPSGDWATERWAYKLL